MSADLHAKLDRIESLVSDFRVEMSDFRKQQDIRHAEILKLLSPLATTQGRLERRIEAVEARI